MNYWDRERDEVVTVDTPYDSNNDKFIFVSMDQYLDNIDLEGYSKEEYLKMYIR